MKKIKKRIKIFYFYKLKKNQFSISWQNFKIIWFASLLVLFSFSLFFIIQIISQNISQIERFFQFISSFLLATLINHFIHFGNFSSVKSTSYAFSLHLLKISFGNVSYQNSCFMNQVFTKSSFLFGFSELISKILCVMLLKSDQYIEFVWLSSSFGSLYWNYFKYTNYML